MKNKLIIAGLLSAFSVVGCSSNSVDQAQEGIERNNFDEKIANLVNNNPNINKANEATSKENSAVTYTLLHRGGLGTIPSFKSLESCKAIFEKAMSLEEWAHSEALCIGTDGSMYEVDCNDSKPDTFKRIEGKKSYNCPMSTI